MSIRDERVRLLDMMAQLDPRSEDYATLGERLEQLTKSEQNDKGWKSQLGCGIAQTAISAISSSINVWSVLRHEDRGNIVTTKALNYAPKPQEHNTPLRMTDYNKRSSNKK